jgi:hypothetical protein
MSRVVVKPIALTVQYGCNMLTEYQGGVNFYVRIRSACGERSGYFYSKNDITGFNAANKPKVPRNLCEIV